jgi:hypothetical protein
MGQNKKSVSHTKVRLGQLKLSLFTGDRIVGLENPPAQI